MVGECKVMLMGLETCSGRGVLSCKRAYQGVGCQVATFSGRLETKKACGGGGAKTASKYLETFTMSLRKYLVVS